jgi:maltose alpha-D-glucosyltransferase/alpha-amylase
VPHTWLADAVIYEIYPQSFADSNADGIGDLRGVIDHLDHLAWLGVNTIWFNPCFASPFFDAGYDVSDYLSIAPRYGTNADMAELIREAGDRGIRVLLDLVAGHTSIEHEWFQREVDADGADPLGDRYVWAVDPPLRDTSNDLAGEASWVASPGARRGYYLKNFYDEQPALNFGWAHVPADEPWRDAVDALGPRRNRQALIDIMAFWLDLGVAGFRVDMAFSLVKDDPGHVQTSALWREIRDWLATSYPDAVIIPEGTEPRNGQRLAFDADFFLVIYREHSSLFDDHAAGTLPWHDSIAPFFHADGEGTTEHLVRGWEYAHQDDPGRLVVMASGDHDFNRLSTGSRTQQQLAPAFAFLLTWGFVPSIYYGDEIGMRYVPGLPNVEGAICNPTYNRAGCRTPMQWDDRPNAGFSSADADLLYLPIDPDPGRPNVTAQRADPYSTLNFVRDLLALRASTSALRTDASTRVINAGYPFAYLRGDSHLVVINPTRMPLTLTPGEIRVRHVLMARDCQVDGDVVTLEPFGFGIFEILPESAGAPDPTKPHR